VVRFQQTFASGNFVHLLRSAHIEGTIASAQHEAIVISYQNLFKYQDDQIFSLTQEVRRLQIELKQERATAKIAKVRR
jgi:hypothetical protein